MDNIWISCLVICGLTAYSSFAFQHNLLYGQCSNDNNTILIYTQNIAMENSNASQIVPKPNKKWYHFFTSPFRGSESTKSSLNTTMNVINTTVEFPPAVSPIPHFIHHKNGFTRCSKSLNSFHFTFESINNR